MSMLPPSLLIQWIWIGLPSLFVGAVLTLIVFYLVRRRWRPVFVVIVLGSVGALAILYVQLRDNYDLCETEDPHVFTGPHGDRVEMDSRFCGWLAGDPGTIVVHYRPAEHGHRSIIFAFNPTWVMPATPDPPWYPEVTWVAPDRVVISITQISQIQRQAFVAGGTHFDYHIGKVDYP
jgi:hypothetical protein